MRALGVGIPLTPLLQLLDENLPPTIDYSSLEDFTAMYLKNSERAKKLLEKTPAGIKVTEIQYPTRDGFKNRAKLFQPEVIPEKGSPLIVLVQSGFAPRRGVEVLIYLIDPRRWLLPRSSRKRGAELQELGPRPWGDLRGPELSPGAEVSIPLWPQRLLGCTQMVCGKSGDLERQFSSWLYCRWQQCRRKSCRGPGPSSPR